MAALMTILTILHVFLCLLLILLILLQSGKGSDIGSMLGGGASQTLFGPAGGKNIIVRITTVVAILILVITITLARFSKYSGPEQSRLVAELQKEAAGTPATKSAAASVTPEAKPLSGVKKSVTAEAKIQPRNKNNIAAEAKSPSTGAREKTQSVKGVVTAEKRK
jgi:preprotein translocase subunit SecG